MILRGSKNVNVLRVIPAVREEAQQELGMFNRHQEERFPFPAVDADRRKIRSEAFFPYARDRRQRQTTQPGPKKTAALINGAIAHHIKDLLPFQPGNQQLAKGEIETAEIERKREPGDPGRGPGGGKFNSGQLSKEAGQK